MTLLFVWTPLFFVPRTHPGYGRAPLWLFPNSLLLLLLALLLATQIDKVKPVAALVVTAVLYLRNSTQNYCHRFIRAL